MLEEFLLFRKLCPQRIRTTVICITRLSDIMGFFDVIRQAMGCHAPLLGAMLGHKDRLEMLFHPLHLASRCLPLSQGINKIHIHSALCCHCNYNVGYY